MGFSRQPTKNEDEYIFWNIDYLEVAYGYDCKRWSFKEKDGEVEFINLTAYHQFYGAPQTDFKVLKRLNEFYDSTTSFPLI